MNIHHLNCGTMYPFGLPRDDDTGGFFKRGHGVIHCLLVDTGDGLVLVDTGWGTQDCIRPSQAVRQFMDVVGSTRDVEETAVRQITALGYDAADVRHVFLTHMHMDHAGGLPDFPTATVHLLAAELDACRHPRTLFEWRAYRPEHRAHGPRWQPHALGADQWFGLDCASPVAVGETEFVMLPFTGHTRGHCAVAVRVGERWLLHCGDTYGYYRQADPVQPYRHPCGPLMERLVTAGFAMPRRHWPTVRDLLRAQGDNVRAFCTHDAHEFHACQENARSEASRAIR